MSRELILIGISLFCISGLSFGFLHVIKTKEKLAVRLLRLEQQATSLQSQLNLKADKDKLHDLLGDKELSVELDGKGISDNVYKSVRSEHMYIRPKEGGEIRFT